MKVTAVITFFLIYFLSINFFNVECVLMRRNKFIRRPICISLAGEFECEYPKNSLNLFRSGHFNFLDNYIEEVKDVPVSNKLLDFNNFLWNNMIRFEKSEKGSNFLKFSIANKKGKIFPLKYDNQEYHLQSFSITKKYNTIANNYSDLEFLFFLTLNTETHVSGPLLRLSVFFRVDDETSKYVTNSLFENILSVLNFNEKNKTTEKTHKEFEVFNTSVFSSYLDKNSNFMIHEFQIDKIAETLVCNKQLISVVIQDIFPISRFHLEKITKFMSLINIGNNTHLEDQNKINHFSFSNKALELKKFVKNILYYKNKVNAEIVNLNILKKPLPNYFQDLEDEIELNFDFPITNMINRVIKHPPIIEKVNTSGNKSNRTMNITSNSQNKLNNHTLNHTNSENLSELLNQIPMINVMQGEKSSTNSINKEEDDDNNINLTQLPQIQKLVKIEEHKNFTKTENKTINFSLSHTDTSFFLHNKLQNTSHVTNISVHNQNSTQQNYFHNTNNTLQKENIKSIQNINKPPIQSVSIPVLGPQISQHEKEKSSTPKEESESSTMLKNLQPFKNLEHYIKKNNSKIFIPKIYKNEKFSITPEGGLDYEETLIIGDEDPETIIIKK
jgi:hypothetical protein